MNDPWLRERNHAWVQSPQLQGSAMHEAPPRSHRRRRISFFQFRFILSMVSKGSHFKFMIDDSISGNQWHVSCGGGES
ncbi:hypothetical protein P8452_16425 [Trifolium repens]|nr:hypothetical protein P8452_16425 [Trifolium repens]